MKQRIISGMMMVGLACVGCANQPVSNNAAEISDLKKQIIALQKVQGQQQAQIEELNNKLMLLRDRPATQVESGSQADAPVQGPASAHGPGQPRPRAVGQMSLHAQSSNSVVAPVISAGSEAAGVGTGAGSDVAEKLYAQAQTDAKKPQTQALERDVETLLKSYRESPATNNALFLLADTLYQRKQYSKAAEQYERLYKLFPDGNKAVGSLYRLGLCYEQMGHSDEAKEAYQNVISIYPGSREALDAAKRLEAGAGEQ